jgi:hypothetical protein
VAIGNSEVLQQLSQNITEKRWREVFLLTAGMMRNSDELMLLMKGQIDQLLVGDEKTQAFLNWTNEKARLTRLFCKPAALRAFYFKQNLVLNTRLHIWLDIENNFQAYSHISLLRKTLEWGIILCKAIDESFAQYNDPKLDKIINRPRRKRTGYGSRSAPEPKDSDCSLSASPRAAGNLPLLD